MKFRAAFFCHFLNFEVITVSVLNHRFHLLPTSYYAANHYFLM
jgi:hypothetical protein